MVKNEIKLEEDSMVMCGFDDCIMGISMDGRAIYSYDKLLMSLVKNSKPDIEINEDSLFEFSEEFEEASEYVDYNMTYGNWIITRIY